MQRIVLSSESTRTWDRSEQNGWRSAARGRLYQTPTGWTSGLALALLLFVGGCSAVDQQDAAAQVHLTLEPSPPEVGVAQIALTITDPRGTPVDVTEVRVEGNMNHAGMKPSFADLREVSPGTYTGTLEFTMGGDWFALVSATLGNGTALEHKVDILGVKSK